MPFFKKEKDDLVLILDVESSIVRGSLVLLSESAKPHVLLTYSTYTNGKAEDDPNYLIKKTLDAIDESIKAVKHYINANLNSKNSQGLPHKISSVHYALSTPWIVSEAGVLSFTFDSEVCVTRQYVRSLVEKERSKMTASNRNDVEVVEQKIFDVRLNGYSIANWENAKTRSLEVSFTVSIAGKKMVESFVKTCQHLVRHNKIFFHSSLILQHIALNKIALYGQNYALVHVHGRLTDVAVISHGSCTFMGSFPFGVDTLVDKVAKITGNDRHAADSLITLCTGGRIDKMHGKTSVEMVNSVTAEWSKGLQNLSSGIVDKLSYQTIVIYALAHDDCFVSSLKKDLTAVNAIALSIQNLLSEVSFDNQAEKCRLVALQAIAVHTINEA